VSVYSDAFIIQTNLRDVVQSNQGAEGPRSIAPFLERPGYRPHFFTSTTWPPRSVHILLHNRVASPIFAPTWSRFMLQLYSNQIPLCNNALTPVRRRRSRALQAIHVRPPLSLRISRPRRSSRAMPRRTRERTLLQKRTMVGPGSATLPGEPQETKGQVHSAL
jgi:hypothetical protein